MPLSAKLKKGVAQTQLNRSRAIPLPSTASFACGENRNAAARARATPLQQRFFQLR